MKTVKNKPRFWTQKTLGYNKHVACMSMCSSTAIITAGISNMDQIFKLVWKPD